MKTRKTLVLISLMIAGEMVFMLPFVVSRIFRPTFLKVFDVTNLELGLAFSVYGIVAMFSYFAGGPIADRYSPRKLMTVSLIVTALGGIIMGFIPSLFTLTLLYGFWGLSTILLYWSASIKAIRAYGGEQTQGRAFGMVDAGRGFVAALIASLSVLILNYLLPVHADNASVDDLSKALGQIIFIFSGLVVASAVLVWFAFPKTLPNIESSRPKLSLEGVKSAMKKRTIWLQALIVLCAYVGYKCTDDFSLYASDVMQMNDVNAAHIGTISFWIRPFAALAAGMLGDRILHSKMAIYCFLIILAGSFIISSGILKPGIEWFIILVLASTSAGIYGLRGIYFALFQESKIPLVYIGSAAGLISVIGYTPDIFMGPLMGFVLDRSPGALGHQHLFAILAGFASIGLVVTLLFRKTVSQRAID
jgi:MFS transporter, GlpU family, inner membrane protein